MKKINKKILFISDNFSKDYWKTYSKRFSKGNYYYDKDSNWMSFTPTLIKEIQLAKNIKKGEYDIILIDYSLIGDTKYTLEREIRDNVKIIEDLYFNCEYVFLQGVMAKYYVEQDVKIFLQRFKVIQNLKIVSYGEDLLYDLYDLIKKEKEK